MSDSTKYAKKHIVPNNILTLAQVGATTDYTATLWVNCPFPVKKISFKFAYVLETDALADYLVSCDLLPAIAIGSLMNFSHETGGNLFYQDGFKQDNAFEYEFKDPALLNSTVTFYFRPTFNGITLVNNKVAVLIECYG